MMSTMSTVSGLHPPLLHRLLQKGQRYTVYHGLSRFINKRPVEGAEAEDGDAHERHTCHRSIYYSW